MKHIRTTIATLGLQLQIFSTRATDEEVKLFESWMDNGRIDEAFKMTNKYFSEAVVGAFILMEDRVISKGLN
jgi:hypothetical protein